MSLTSYRAARPRASQSPRGRSARGAGRVLAMVPGWKPLAALFFTILRRRQKPVRINLKAAKCQPGHFFEENVMADEVDFVVVGGGSGGCAVASRLSEDAATSVALLEAGGSNDNWVVTTPGVLILMISRKVNNWAFNTVPQPGLNGRIGYQPRGQGLGGSSAINAMVYIRGHKSDYDHWAALGNSGWSYADVLPYFKRSENNTELDDEYHGKGGPLNVTNLRSDNPVQEIYLEAARELQLPINADFNGAEQEGLGIYQVTQKNGERWSAARGYIHPFMGNRTNLIVETRAYATRILFDGKRAVGVEYRKATRRSRSARGAKSS